MSEDDFQLELTSPIRSAGRRRKNIDSTDTAEQEGNAKSTVINGLRKEVMTSDTYTRMSPSTTTPEPNINLSREELLKLLSVFEGELQARDEVIEILKSERPNNPGISDRYGLSNMPLRALQRDAASLDATGKDCVGEQTVQNLQKIIQHQKESYKKIKQALLAAEQANQRLSTEITEEKRKHQDYMIKSDDFVNLLEEERERLKISLEKEKELSDKKEADMSYQLKSNKDELAKLKSLSLVLVEERQKQVSELCEYKKQIVDLERRLKEAEIKWKESEVDISAEKDHAMQLENDLEMQTDKFFQTQEEFNTKFQEEREKNSRLEEKVASLTQQLKKLQSIQRNLQKTDDRLWRIHEKLEQEDEEHELLLEEVELLRQRVKDMEEGEKIYIQAQEDSKDIKQKLEEEIALTRNLRSQLNRLQTQAKAQKDLQRSIEDTDFRFDELQLKFEFEKRKSNDMKEHLQKMKSRMMELDQFEKIVQESEEKMKQMKEKIILLTDKKKCSDDQVKFLIEKNDQLRKEIKSEKDKVTEITEKLIKESKRVLKIREELSQEKQKYSTEITPLQTKLKDAEQSLKEMLSNRQSQAEEANDRLRRQVILLKTRLDELEKESEKKGPKSPLPSTSMSMELVDVVNKLHEAEQRCDHLTQQLQAKSTLCEDLRKKVAQANQSNNNSKDVVKTNGDRAKKDGPTSPLLSESKTADAKIMVTTTTKLKSTKISPGLNLPSTNTGYKGLSKSSWVSSSSLTRSGRVKKVADVSKTQTEESDGNKPNTQPTATPATTITVTKDGRTGQTVIKTLDKPVKKNPTPSCSVTKSGKPESTGYKTPQKIHVAGRAELTEKEEKMKRPVENNTARSNKGSVVQSTSQEEEHQPSKAAPSSLTRSSKIAPLEQGQDKAETPQSTAASAQESISSDSLKKDQLKQKDNFSRSNANNGKSKGHNQDSKIPKNNAPPRYFRSFQAQKDFTELQKKWAAKLGK